MLAALSVQASAIAAAPLPMQYVYFGTYTSEKSQGIYVAAFDPNTGNLGSAQLAAKTRNPTFLALDPSNRIVYAANEIGDFGGGRSGAVSAFKVDPTSGRLEFLNEQPSGGDGPCHLAVAQSGKCVLVANYGSGSVAVLPIESDGRLRAPSVSLQHRGASINPQRQEGPHAHFITGAPDNRLVLSCDLGLDQVLIYRLDPSQLTLSPNNRPFFGVKPGSGPRHLVFHPNGDYVYVLNEISSTLTCCSYQSGKGELKEIQTVSTLPEDFAGANTCAEIQIHPSGRFLYASNRGHNSVAVFTIEAGTGRVKLLQHAPTEGKTPRHFCLDPSARWLLAENQDSDNVVVFALDAASGRVTPTGQSQKVGAPVCAVFVAKQ